MTGVKITVPTTFTNPSLPELRLDPVIPNAGALLLVDLSHPENPVTVSPTNGLTIPNLALAQAQAMYPSGTASTLGAFVNIGATFLGPLGLVERSAKGGFHFAVGATTADPVTRYARIEGGSALAAYLNANKSHGYYHSVWARVTRAPSPSAGGGIPHGRIGASFQLPYFYLRPTGNAVGPPVYPGDARLGTNWMSYGAVGMATTGAGATSKTDTGPVFWSGAVSDFTAVADIVAGASVIWNPTGAALAGGTLGLSSVHYRTYVEDLTVSGRSYATVQSLDFAEFTKQVLTVGGRYYGDTFTDPATLV